MAVQIIYETHALTEDNEAGIATGWWPGKLSAEGRRLAAAMGERRSGQGIAAVFVSDLVRAVETATIAFAHTDIPIIQDARLRECNYGRLNGMPASRLAAERSLRIDTPYPEGQSYRHVVDAMSAVLHELASAWDGQRLLMIAHSANKWALDCLLLGKRLEDLVDAPFGWQEGWEYVIPDGWAKGPVPHQASIVP